MLTETWLHQQKESLVNIEGYNIMTTNRVNRIGRGVAVVTHKTCHIKKLDSFSSTTMSALWILTQHYKRTPIIYGVICYPPSANSLETLNYLTTTITKLQTKHQTAKLVLTGDFNRLDTTFIADTFKLKNIVPFSTRGDAQLDKILTNMEEYRLENCNKLAPLANNDHCCITVTNCFRKPYQYIYKLKRKSTRATKMAVEQDIALLDWTPVLEAHNIDEKVNTYYNMINSIVDQHCPLRKIKISLGNRNNCQTTSGKNISL